jgi:hypothetical protein
MKLRIGDSNGISADLDDGIERLIRRALEQVAPDVFDEIEQETERLLNDAVSEWPVGPERGRAHSRDLMRDSVELSPDLDSIRGRITNTADYARFIVSRKTWYRNAYVELLRKPARRALGRIAKAVAKRAAKAMEK